MLVTGAAGSIGRVVTVGLLARGARVVSLDRVPEPDGDQTRFHTVECTDPDAVAAVFAEERLDAVVHLAGHPDEASLPDSLTSHVVTTAALLDAMVEHDVTSDGLRLVQPRRRPHAVVASCSRPAPGRAPTPSTASGKVAAEALLSLYADRYGLDAVACRIGSFLPRPETTRQLSTWLSPSDCVRMVDAALTRDRPGLRGALRHLRQHPRLVGPRRPAARSATSRRTTPRPTPTRSAPPPRTTGTAPTSAVRSRPRRTTVPPWTAATEGGRT